MTTELVPYTAPGAFALAQIQDPAAQFKSVVTKQDFSVLDLMQVHVPSGGAVTWEVPDLDAPGGVDAVRELDVVVLSLQGKIRKWWARAADDAPADDKQPPDCVSFDSLVGVGNNRLDQDPVGAGDHECAACPHNQWGSDRKGGKGKDCGEALRLYAIRRGSLMPFVISASPTSLKGARDYLKMIANQGRKPYSIVTRITLEKQEEGNRRWSTMKFAPAPEGRIATSDLPKFEAMEAVIDAFYAEDAKRAMTTRRGQLAAAATQRAAAGAAGQRTVTVESSPVNEPGARADGDGGFPGSTTAP